MKKPAVAVLMIATLAPRAGRGDPPAAPSQEAEDLERAFRAAGDDPRARAAWTGPPEVPAITVEHYRLPNGLDVVLSPGGSTSLVDVRVTYAAGARDAPAGRPELPHLVEHLSYAPTRRVPEGLLSATEGLGATSLWAFTGLRETTFGVEVPPEALERALWIEGERMAGALDEVDDADVARERRVWTREMAFYREGPDADVLPAASAAAVAAGRPPHVPNQSNPSGSVAEVRAFARRWYVPANARLTIVGRFSPPQARASIARYLGALGGGAPPVRARDAATAPLGGGLVKRVRPARPRANDQVAVVWPMPSLDEPDGVEAQLLGECLTSAQVGDPLLGAGLATGVRVIELSAQEGRSLYYAPPAYPPFTMLLADVFPGRTTGEALAALDGSLARYRDELEREGCPEGVVRGYAWRLAAAAADLPVRASRIARWPDPDDPGAFRRHLERARAAGRGGLGALARRWFSADRRIVVHVAARLDASP